MSASPAVAPLSDIPKAVQSLHQLTNSIQKQHSPHLPSDYLWTEIFNLLATQIRMTSYKLCLL